MGIKLTQQKQASEDSARREHRRWLEEIKQLSPLERLKYDIGVLKSQEKNVVWDIEHMGNSTCLSNKLKGIRDQIKEKEKELVKTEEQLKVECVES